MPPRKAAPKKRTVRKASERPARSLALDIRNPLTTEITLTIDRPRKLRFTMLESAEFRRRTGISVMKDGLDPLELNEDELLHFLCAANMAEDPDVTPADLAPHIVGDRFVVVLGAVLTLASDFSPQGEGDQNPLVASVRSLLTTPASGRSRHRPSASPIGNTGRSHPA